MLVIFTSPAYSNITMFGNVALSLIKLMGHSETVPGAILADDIPTALERLKTGVASASQAVEKNAKPDSDDDEEPRISIGQRAIPLIEMLEAAAKEECNVMWDKGS